MCVGNRCWAVCQALQALFYRHRGEYEMCWGLDLTGHGVNSALERLAQVCGNDIVQERVRSSDGGLQCHKPR